MRADQLTFTRFIAALFVVFFHHQRFIPMMEYTNVFVSYFYILSGFVLTISRTEPFKCAQDYYKFYLNRVARIYPMYALALILSIFFPPVERNYSLMDLMLSGLGIQSFFPGHVLTYNFPGWSISVELFFYFSFPFFVHRVFQELKFRQIFVFTIVFWLLSQAYFFVLYYSGLASSQTAYEYLFYFPVNHLNEFVCGSFLGVVYKRTNTCWFKNYDWHLIGFGAIIFLYLNYIKPLSNIFDHNGLLVLLFGPMILLLSLNTGGITKLFKRRLFILAGEISFGVYIMAEPVLKFLRELSLKINVPRISYFHYSLFILIVISCLLYLYFEKPMQKVIRSSFLKSKQQVV
jgi:peptidoglycan/LPS O-acetylase OafA/YrhL